MDNEDDQNYTRVINLLNSDDVKTRFLAVYEYNNFDFNQVMQSFKHQNPTIRNLAANRLGKIGDLRAVDSLIESIYDWEVCHSAIRALGSLKASQAVEPLIAFLEKKEPFTHLRPESIGGLRSFAIEALGEIGDKRALPIIEWCYQNDKGKSSRGITVKETAAEAIRKIETY